MHLLIDGYNLLHQSDLLGSARGHDWLEKARQRLFAALQAHCDEHQLLVTTVVFDRHTKKQIDSDQRLQSGIRVLYAIDYPEADDLIERLIAKHPHAKTLLLVSSDHRLQKAAKRKGAQFVDAEVWYDSLLAGTYQSAPRQQPSEKPDAELSQQEIQQWLREFSAPKPDDKDSGHGQIENPFPDGYAEDLLN